MKKSEFTKRAGRVVAGVQILFNLGTAPKPPEMTVQGRTQELQSQWANNEVAHVLPEWNRRATELGYDLREPVSAEYRAREGLGLDQPGDAKQRDIHERDLSARPSRDGRGSQSDRSQSRSGSASEALGRKTGGREGRDR